MTNSTAIMGTLTDAVKKGMSEQARALSLEGVKSATELAEAYFFLASAGMDANEAMANLPVVLQFATAGMFGLEGATTLLVDSTNALGLATGNATEDMAQMTRVADVLVKANQLANASTEQYANALTNKAASALRLTNKELEEGVAVLTAFASAGIKGARGGTFLDIALRELRIKAVKNKEAFADMDIEVFNAGGDMKNMADIVEDLEDRFRFMSTEATTAGLSQLGFTSRSVFAIQTLIGFSKKIRDAEEALKKAGGTMQSVADKNLASFDAQIGMLMHKFQFIEKEIGEQFVPVVQSMNDAMKIAIVLWKGLDDETKKWIVGIGAAAAAIGPLIGLMGTLGVLAIHFAGAIKILALFAGHMLVAGVAIATVIALMDYFASNDDFTNAFQLTILDIETGWNELVVNMGFLALKMINNFDKVWAKIGKGAGDMALWSADKIKSVFEVMVTHAASAWMKLKQMVKENPFQASQDARRNVAFAESRVKDIGLDPDAMRGKSNREVYSMVSGTGASKLDTGEAVSRVKDLNVALQAEQDKHNSAMNEKKARQHQFDLKMALLDVNDRRIAEQKMREIVKIGERKALRTSIIGGKNPADFDTFYDHLGKRLLQLQDKFKDMKTVSRKQWQEITKDSKKEMDEIYEGWKNTTEKMADEGFVFSDRMKKVFKDMESGFTSAWENMFTSMMEGTATLQQAFQTLGMELLKVVAQQALIKPLSGMMSGGTSSSVEGAFGMIGSLAGMFGGVGAGPTVAGAQGVLNSGFNSANFASGGAFGAGGVLNSPTPFSMGDGRMGVAGEAGPEAALPLSRMSDGKLGVAMAGGGGAKTVNQVFNISTPDADSFKRSQRQISKRARNL